MRFIHLADLHIGKRISEISMLDDQKYILDKIIQIAKERKIQAVLISGDVYDRPIPPQEAVELLDSFITKLCELDIKCMIISGNHDSPERLAFGCELLERAGIYISPVFSPKLKMVTLKDEYGDVDFVLLPFLRPAHIKRYFDVSENDCAIKAVLDNNPKREGIRTVLLAHQFVTAFGKQPDQCDSEVMSVGTVDAIDVDVFKDYDYVALGHIHGPQRVGYDHIRYAGSPLKFSFSEVNHKKSVPLVELDKDGNAHIELIPLEPKRDMKKLKASINDILSETENKYDYMHITLTDDAVMDAMQKVKTVYPNTMSIEFENSQTKSFNIPKFENGKSFDIKSFFEEFYEVQNGQPISEEMKKLLDENSMYGEEI